MFKVKINIAPAVGTELLSYLSSKTWDLVDNEIKVSASFSAFKFKIKRWVPKGYPCRIYLGQVEYIVT